jgi:hypothetical protein
MLKRIPFVVLLVIQALGGGAVRLAHARDAVVAPPGYEAGHSARCAILHDELRCALCQYASARVVTPPIFILAEPRAAMRFAPVQPFTPVPTAVRLTSSARAPPVLS